MVTILSAMGSTNAADETTMNEAQLDGLLTGNTLYIAVPPGGAAGPDSATVPFHYGAMGRAIARLSSKMTLVGSWSVDGDKYCANWDNGPKNSCTKLIKSHVGIALVDVDNGETRGMVESIVPGNPEGLKEQCIESYFSATYSQAITISQSNF